MYIESRRSLARRELSSRACFGCLLLWALWRVVDLDAEKACRVGSLVSRLVKVGASNAERLLVVLWLSQRGQQRPD